MSQGSKGAAGKWTHTHSIFFPAPCLSPQLRPSQDHQWLLSPSSKVTLHLWEAPLGSWVPTSPLATGHGYSAGGFLHLSNHSANGRREWQGWVFIKHFERKR